MRFLKKLFGHAEKSGPSKSPETQRRTSGTSGSRRYSERDNVGTRCDTQGEGEAYFFSLMMKPEPLIFYFFDSKEKATQALAEVSCLAVAVDSNKLICTETLTFGVFPAVDHDDSPTWGALLAGKNLSYDVWSEAQECLKKHGGRMRREDEPSKSTSAKPKKEGDPSLVKFSHNRRDIVAGAPATYLHYQAPDKASALAWLQQNPVDKQSFFLVIETPEGTFARDIKGIYEA